MRKETLRRIGWAIVPVSVVGFVWVGVAAAAFDAQKCERKKVFATGKYFKCLAKAEAKAIKKDRVADTAKCDEKFRKKLKRYEARGAGLCPTGQYFEEIRSRAAQELRFPIWEQDFASLRQLGANAIKIYGMDPIISPADPGWAEFIYGERTPQPRWDR